MGDVHAGTNQSNTVSNADIKSSDRHLFTSPTSMDEKAKATITKKQLEEQPTAKIARPCRFFFRKGSCRHGNNCRFSHEMEGGQQHSQQEQRNGNRSQPCHNTGVRNKNNTRKRKRGGHTSSDTLLRKLLQNDMERESTISLQLLKFIVDNNFFMDVGDKSKEKGGKADRCVTLEKTNDTNALPTRKTDVTSII